VDGQGLRARAQLLEEEITPKLDKLREEKRSFLEYQRATSELERLTRLAKAHEWQTLHARYDEKRAALKARKGEMRAQEEGAEALKRQIAGIDKELAQIERRRDQELAKGGKLQALVEKSKQMAHDVVKEQSHVDFKVTSLDEESKKVLADDESLAALRAARDEKQQELAELSTSFGALKATYDEEVAQLNRQDELLQTLQTGMGSKASGSDGAQQGGFMGQLAEVRAQEAALGTEVEQAKLRITHAQKECKTKEPLAKKAERESAGLVKELAASRAAAAALEAKVSSTGWDEQKEKELLAARASLSSKVSQLYESRDRIKSRLAGMDFSYSDPEPNFDRSSVKGLIASLVSLDEDKHKYATALEICAGGRLYNVVVDNEAVGSKLLANGRLKKRVTLIPLNKISATVAAAQRIGAAEKIAPGKVNLALTLIGYEDEVSAAMAYVFGNTLICSDSETAKRVTIDNAVKMKSVTLDGDVYDPQGTLSGGSKPSTGGVLVKMQELNNVERELASARKELASVEAQMKAANEQMAAFSKLRRELDLKRHEVTLVEAQVQGSNATRVSSAEGGTWVAG
jgi:structural maintenance of chromosome 2